ncbi:RidA family protein [Pseudomonas sp. Q1]|uniref:RidA family protein n=1 Tax=Pseudomonas sp. Q1 TaxID=2202823 RepID=UPI001374F96D|nr:RidA family protein [Pseudomonas sp. Q1]NCE83789.1 RidA family protein [Pseudomonas sp. Q1]
MYNFFRNTTQLTIASAFVMASSLCNADQTTSEGASLNYVASDGTLPFSTLVRAGNLLFLSGALATENNGAPLKSTAAQTATIMDNIQSTLTQNNSSLNQVVRCNVILADIQNFSEMNRVYASYFKEGRFPARTTFEASNLVAGAKVEIECTAYVDA